MNIHLRSSALIFVVLLTALQGGASAQEAASAPAPVPPPRPALTMPVQMAIPPAQVPPAQAPLAGYADGFFIRSADNNFVLWPNGRMNFDGFFFLNRGAAPMGPPPGTIPDGPADPRPRDTFFIRRARAELGGELVHHFDWYIAGEFGTTPGGAQYATFTDVYINGYYTSWLNLQVGQYDAPFSMENRTSDKYIDFMERSLAVRALTVPTNKELGAMIWGRAPRNLVYYSAGVFNGDGNDVKNLDSHFDILARATFSPLALLPAAEKTRWLQDIWIGGSVWWGQRVDVPYNIPALTTQGGVTLMPSAFTVGMNSYNLSDDGDLLKWGVELNAPVGPFGLRFELDRIENERVGVYNQATTVNGRQPLGHVGRTGTAFYVQAWYWVLGDYRMLPTPGQEIPKRWSGYTPADGRWKLGLWVSAKYERMVVSMGDIGQNTGMMAGDISTALIGGMTVDVAEAAVNLWVTKHLRLSANYIMNYLDGDMKLVQSPNNYKVFTYYQTPEHELLFRAAIGL